MKIDIDQLEFIDRNLRDILLFIEKSTGVEFTITSLYRIGDSGVHGQLPLRGTDLRVRCYALGQVLEQMINEKFWYDPQRPELSCALLHGGGANLHLHLQVHPNTIAV